MKRKIVSLLLCLAVLFSASGCGSPGLPFHLPESVEEPVSSLKEKFQSMPNPLSGVFPNHRDGRVTHAFSDAWHADEVFDKEFFARDSYDPMAFSAASDTMRALAESGGKRKDFNAADDELWYWVLWSYDAWMAADLALDGDPADEKLQADSEEMQALYIDVSNAYFDLLQTVASSGHSSVMEDYYSDEDIEYYAGMDLDTEADDAFTKAESTLVRKYYALMAEDAVDEDAVAEIYLELVSLRNDYAESIGYENYADYAYAETFCRDYTPEDAVAFHNGVKEFFAPIWEKYGDEFYDAWEELDSDRSIDCESDVVLDAVKEVLPLISTELADAMDYMIEYNLYDIEPSPTRANRGYTFVFFTLNEPYLFNTPYGDPDDYFDLIHEFGHFSNYFYTESSFYGMDDYDLSEVQSQGLEMLFTQYYDRMFGEKSADAARIYKLMDMLISILDGALYDEFQQRVYSTPNLTAEDLNDIFAELYEAYGYGSCDGWESNWMYISHNFDDPFYYISYGVSALGALEIYALLQTDEAAAIDGYLELCAMDPQEWYYSEAVEEAGLGSFLEEETYRTVSDVLRDALR